ncbi:hypothetical protein [Pontibacter akesuensis]|uniref:hypothetical protein n=1 Tax=Pontibacter akesuensis TaxID=388950 RepID=UPI000A9A9503|nr:hypothetical protein [Pontibacter akesuensis]GHA75748.1 hypothetical protein GCM10007389_32080 [Pontibacter akesuensis]
MEQPEIKPNFAKGGTENKIPKKDLNPALPPADLRAVENLLVCLQLPWPQE